METDIIYIAIRQAEKFKFCTDCDKFPSNTISCCWTEKITSMRPTTSLTVCLPSVRLPLLSFYIMFDRYGYIIPKPPDKQFKAIYLWDNCIKECTRERL